MIAWSNGFVMSAVENARRNYQKEKDLQTSIVWVFKPKISSFTIKYGNARSADKNAREYIMIEVLCEDKNADERDPVCRSCVKLNECKLRDKEAVNDKRNV